MVIRDGPACPHCGEVALYQKASAIYEAQTFRVRGTGSARTVSLGLALSTRGVVPVLAGMVGRGSAVGVKQTDLAARLAPPTPPRDRRPDPMPPPGQPVPAEAVLWGGLLAGALVAYLGMGGIVLFLTLELPAMLAIPAAAVGATGAGALAGFLGPRWARANAAARVERHERAVGAWAQWDRDRASWDRLWHCLRCGREREEAA